MTLFHWAKDKIVKARNPRLTGDCSGLWGDCSGLTGVCTGLRGDCSGLRGDCSGLRGVCTGLRGDCSGLWGNCTGLTGVCTGLRGDCSGLRGDIKTQLATIWTWKHPISIYANGKIVVGCKTYDNLPAFKAVSDQVDKKTYDKLARMVKAVQATMITP